MTGSSPMEDNGRFAEARASEKIYYAAQNAKAVRTVAGYAADAEECARLLAMLGLDPQDGKRVNRS